jgi:hypothetical protein
MRSDGKRKSTLSLHSSILSGSGVHTRKARNRWCNKLSIRSARQTRMTITTGSIWRSFVARKNMFSSGLPARNRATSGAFLRRTAKSYPSHNSATSFKDFSATRGPNAKRSPRMNTTISRSMTFLSFSPSPLSRRIRQLPRQIRPCTLSPLRAFIRLPVSRASSAA